MCHVSCVIYRASCLVCHVSCVDKLGRLCVDVQSRHSESLQLNVNSPLYKKFAKYQNIRCLYLAHILQPLHCTGINRFNTNNITDSNTGAIRTWWWLLVYFDSCCDINITVRKNCCLAYRLATVDRRSFPVAASIPWNSLPPDIQSSASLTDFCHRLKTYLFYQSFLQTFCCNYPHIDFAFVNFLMTPVILAMFEILIWVVELQNWFGNLLTWMSGNLFVRMSYVIVWRLRGNIIRTVLYIANVLPLQWA